MHKILFKRRLSDRSKEDIILNFRKLIVLLDGQWMTLICCCLCIFFLTQPLTVVSNIPSGSVVKNLPATQETQVQSLGQEDPLEEGMATHSSVLA